MAKDRDDNTWYRRSETEDDRKGTYLGHELNEFAGEDEMREWYLLHGGSIWRTPWTY